MRSECHLCGSDIRSTEVCWACGVVFNNTPIADRLAAAEALPAARVDQSHPFSPGGGRATAHASSGGPGSPASGAYRSPGSYGGPGVGPKPNSYLVWAVLSVLFCFLPFGLPAVVFAAKVDVLWSSGRPAEALVMSRKARSWLLASVLTTCAVLVVYVLVTVAATPNLR